MTSLFDGFDHQHIRQGCADLRKRAKYTTFKRILSACNIFLTERSKLQQQPVRPQKGASANPLIDLLSTAAYLSPGNGYMYAGVWYRLIAQKGICPTLWAIIFAFWFHHSCLGGLCF